MRSVYGSIWPDRMREFGLTRQGFVPWVLFEPCARANFSVSPMMLLPTRTRLLHVALASSAIALSVTSARGQQPAAPTTASIMGIVVDSIHGTVLANALVRVDASSLETMTDSGGRFKLLNVPPGRHQLVVFPPIEDTLGLRVVSPSISVTAGDIYLQDLAIPSPERLVGLLCPAGVLKMRGPAAVVGFVHDPVTGDPAPGAKIQLLYDETDPLGLTKKPVVRSATTDSAGNYKICGVPPNMEGKVIVTRNGVVSGEVPAKVENGFLALRSFGILGKVRVAAQQPAAPGDTSHRPPRYIGEARVSGRVVNKQGQPLYQARVALQGSDAVTLTKPNGEFTLDSLPAGTQSLEVRKLGYGVTDYPIELANGPENPRVTITMSDFVPTLATVRVEAQENRALLDNGYLQRKDTHMGMAYLDGDQIRQSALHFSDELRTVPGLKIVPIGDGTHQAIVNARDVTATACVNFVVDGTPFKEVQPGDIDDFLQPSELAAIEVYSPSTTPAQFQSPGSNNCISIVAWTKRGTPSKPKKKP